MLPRAFFDHVFKTAGTSLQTILIGHYGGESLCRADSSSTAAAFEQGRDFPLIAGHVEHVKGFLPFRHRACFTLLRHPVERAVSAYRHLQRQPLPSPDLAVRAAHVLSMEEFATGVLTETAIVRDFQTRHFAAMGAGAQGDSLLDSAKAALSLYHAFGVQEEFELAVGLVCASLGVPAPASVPFENAASVAAAELLSDRARRAIERANRNDLALWEWARREARRMRDGRARPTLPAAALPRNTVAAAAPAVRRLRREAGGAVELLQVAVEAVVPGHLPDTPFETGALVRVRVLVQMLEGEADLTVGLRIADAFRQSVFETNSFHLGTSLALHANERVVVEFTLPLDLAPGAYVIDVSGHRGADGQEELYFWRDEACKFDVANHDKAFFRGIAYLPATVACVPATPATLWMSPIDDAQLAVRLRCATLPHSGELAAGTRIMLGVTLRNDSGYELSSHPPAPVMLSYHIANAAGDIVVFDGERTALSAPLRSGEERGILLRATAPEVPGAYVLTPYLLQEGHRWFDERELVDTLPFPFVVLTTAVAFGESA